jgi:hypothetical protein
MKLLNRLRELRGELHPEWNINEADTTFNTNQHLDTIGIGATTIDDIVRLNIDNTPYLRLSETRAETCSK